MEIKIPEFSMVLMVGPSGSGKTTFAQKHFSTTEIVSSDQCRALIVDDPTNRKVNEQTFDLVQHITASRLRNRRLTVVDATNLQPEHRRPFFDIARNNDCPTVVIVMNTTLAECLTRNQSRTDRQVPEHVVRNQYRRLRYNIRLLQKEPVRKPHIIAEEVSSADISVQRTKLHLDRRDLTGPFDIIGDIHGCHDELLDLLSTLGYNGAAPPAHPDGRMAVFLGDIVDRGPASDKVLELVMDMVNAGSALCVAGNHDNKLMRSLRGNPVQPTHGLQETLDQLAERPPEFKERVQQFLRQLPEHYLLDDGKLAVAHAGILEAYQGRISRRVRDFCLYGQTTGETDEWGLPARAEWALEYKGDTVVVYGHTPVEQPRWTNETINVDTGCVFGGKLTALRYPERELVSVPARRTYYEAVRPARTDGTAPSGNGGGTAPYPDGPDETNTVPNRYAVNLADITGHIGVQTDTIGRVNVGERQTQAALEPMSRFCVDPRWLLYLPPTISPTKSTDREGLLEHPAQAFEQYREDGVHKVICEEKHMGSRALVVIARDQSTALQRFGIDDPNAGACYSRTGRRFFTDPKTETAFLNRARSAISDAGMWEDLETPWLLLDCEIMPWSLKAQGLLQHMYAPTSASAINTLQRADALLAQTAARGVDTGDIRPRTQARSNAAMSFREVYREYCWATESIEDIMVAPFHLLAGENRVFSDRDHEWHLAQGLKLHQQDPKVFHPTAYRIVDLQNDGEEQEATKWWENMVRTGGEGMVVKPLEFLATGKHDHIQPAVKVRGPHYLRIIYGPEYLLEGNLERLKYRSLRRKRHMALREFALGLEGLQRFINNEPLSKVHQCAFAVMALETEPMDPRL